MKRLPYFAVLASIVGSASPILAQDAAEVRATIESHYAAIHAQDRESVRQQHLLDFSIFWKDGRVLVEAGFAEAAERMGHEFGFATANVYMSHFNAQTYGDVAVATFYLVDTSGESSKTSRVSAVWVKDGGAWKEAHHHESPLRGGGMHR